MPTKTEALAAYMRERKALSPSIAELVPYLIGVAEIRAFTYRTDTVASADILAILDAIDLVERDAR